MGIPWLCCHDRLHSCHSTILRFQKLTNLDWALTFSCVNIYARIVIRSLLPLTRLSQLTCLAVVMHGH